MFFFSRSCFLKPGPAMFGGILLPIGLVLVSNFVIFGLAMQNLTCRKPVTSHQPASTTSNREGWRRILNALAISILLGLTWVFGFLAIGGARFLFNLLFIVFNSLQGFFVFFLFCLRREEVRRQWLDWWKSLCCCLYTPGKRSASSAVALTVSSSNQSRK